MRTPILALALGLSCSLPTHVRVDAPTHRTPPPVETPSIPTWIDRDFTSNEAKDIASAVETWNTALNGYERFEVVSTRFDMEPEVLADIQSTGTGLVILARVETWEGLHRLPPGTLAWSYVDMPAFKEEAHRISFIPSRFNPNLSFEIVAMHEMGHVLGLGDLYRAEYRGRLMYFEQINGARVRRCVDEATIRALAAVRGWDVGHMNSCSSGGA